MQEPRQWRELLGIIIDDPAEKQRLARELAVDPLILMHWVYGESYPRPQQLYQLLGALPEYSEDLAPFFLEAYEYIVKTRVETLSRDIPPEMNEWLPSAGKLALSSRTKESEPVEALMSGENEADEIDSSFYARILSAIALTPQSLRFGSLVMEIMEQALTHLDLQRKGLALTLVRCMPPRDGKIRSLREAVGVATPPWSNDLTQHMVFVGAHSLEDYAVKTCRSIALNLPRNEDISLSPEEGGFEKSIAVYPILRAHQVAGCLLISSTQLGFFTPTRLTLLQRYVDLLALLFEPGEFYDVLQLELREALPSEQQKPVLATFRQRVSTLLTDSMKAGSP